MSSPAILPISNPQTLTTPDPATNSAVRLYLTSLTETVKSNRRPWSELVDRSAFSKPDSISEATTRIRKNYTYFRINYLAVIASVLAISLLTNPFSLIVLAGLLFSWAFLYLFRQPGDGPVTVFGREFSERETLLFLIVSTIVVVFLTSVGSVLVSALMVGVGIVCLHGAFRAPEDLFLDDEGGQGGASTGFLSFFTGGGGGVVAGQPLARV